jgi:hypothetical protein
MAGIADWYIGGTTLFTTNENPSEFANLTFGHGTNVPSPGSNVSQGHIYSFRNIDVGPPPTQRGGRIQITRKNDVTRGFHIGSVRVGFIKEDVEPPFDASTDADKLVVGHLFCYAQEVNDVPTIEPAPVPGTHLADKVEGFFALSYTIDYATDDILLQLRSSGRLEQLGGGKLVDNVSVPLTKTPGDFTGIEFNWWSSGDPGVDTPRPKIILKGYTFDASDFSDPKLRIATAHDYKIVPSAEKTEYREQQEFLFNIGGVLSDNPDIKNPLLEGMDIELGNLHGYALTHFEILKP